MTRLLATEAECTHTRADGSIVSATAIMRFSIPRGGWSSGEKPGAMTTENSDAPFAFLRRLRCRDGCGMRLTAVAQQHGRFRPIAYVQLLQYPCHVMLDGFLLQVQPASHFLVAVAFRHQP